MCQTESCAVIKTPPTAATSDRMDWLNMLPNWGYFAILVLSNLHNNLFNPEKAFEALD